MDVSKVNDTHVIHTSSISLASEVWMSTDLRRVFQWAVYAVACQLIDVFGTLANIINIICFVKQGFNDSINVSFVGLAISDLGCLATLIFTDICFNPLFQESSLPYDSVELQYLTAAWPHVIFSRVTSWITAYITLERCLCIVMPLKVKTLLTPRRVTGIIATIFVVLICSVSPIYYANRLVWRFSPERNITILGLVVTPDRELVEKISYTINNLFVQFGAFTIVIVCTTILVVNLRSKTKWREKSTTSSQAMSRRDQKVTRMVVVISTMFIISFFPFCAIFTAIIVNPELSVDGLQKNTAMVLVGFAFLSESINSTVNIFFYYHMSSKYRDVFRQLFRLDSKK